MATVFVNPNNQQLVRIEKVNPSGNSESGSQEVEEVVNKIEMSTLSDSSDLDRLHRLLSKVDLRYRGEISLLVAKIVNDDTETMMKLSHTNDDTRDILNRSMILNEKYSKLQDEYLDLRMKYNESVLENEKLAHQIQKLEQKLENSKRIIKFLEDQSDED